MKKFILALLLLFMPISFAEAFPNEPAGLGQLYWGESLKQVQKTYGTEYLGTAYNNMASNYIVKIYDPNGQLGINSPIETICMFTQGKLFAIIVVHPVRPERLDKVYASAKRYFSAQYGPAVNHGQFESWVGNTTTMILSKHPEAVFIILADSSFTKGFATGALLEFQNRKNAA